MARLAGELWEYNLARVVVIDVTDDYRLMQPPLPTECYPVLTETYIPRYAMKRALSERAWVDGYLYDWHETPNDPNGPWYVGVVRRTVMSA